MQPGRRQIPRSTLRSPPMIARPPLVVRMLATALLVIAAVPLRAQNFDTVHVRSTPLAGSVHMLVGSGRNIGLVVGDDTVFVVDDQYAPFTPKILAAIKSITPQPVRF